MAEFLVGWALPDRAGRIFDPSFGGGVFLSAAAKHRHGRCELFGAEIDREAHSAVVQFLQAEAPAHTARLLCTDFFEVDPDSLPPMDAVVGNPPFVRYQKFKGEARERALRRVADNYGVTLPRLTSLWAPFVVHSVGFVRPGGRLAMVLPMELAYARYARPVLQFLAERFQRLHLVSFRRPLFAGLNEDTVLLLADGRTTPNGRLADTTLDDLPNAAALTALQPGEDRIDLSGFIRGARRLVEYFLPEATRQMYARACATGVARRLGELADIGIGYVSGNNAFFHPDRTTQKDWRMPARHLQRALLNGSGLAGLEFNDDDWKRALAAGNAGHLLHLAPDVGLPEGLAGYIRHGEESGVNRAYKCRVREPWFAVPHVRRPDGFLTYMSGARTQIVANAAGVVAPNTLHLVRMRRGCTLGVYDLCARWLTSLTQLSVEIEGHALGGGMLKLEPTEAENVRLAHGRTPAPITEAVAREFDVLLREGEIGRARELADQLFLSEELGLSRRDCELLRDGALLLRNRRLHRKRNPS